MLEGRHQGAAKSAENEMPGHYPNANDAAPASAQWLIVPSDTADLPHGACRTIKCLEDGTIVTRMVGGGDDVSYPAVAGEEFHGKFIRVLATGTSGSYVAWY